MFVKYFFSAMGSDLLTAYSNIYLGMKRHESTCIYFRQ